MIHTVPHLITGARKGAQRQIWWPCSSGGSTAVSRTSDRVSVYGSQHNEWSKVWFKWANPDPYNCSPLSVITTLYALCLGLYTGNRFQGCCFSIVLLVYVDKCSKSDSPNSLNCKTLLWSGLFNLMKATFSWGGGRSCRWSLAQTRQSLL